MIRALVLGALVTACSASVLAETVYRCEDAQGRLQFSQRPCGPNATVLQVEAPLVGTVATDPAEWQSVRRGLRRDAIEQDLRTVADRMDRRDVRLHRHLVALEQRKSHARNNLAGAVYQQAINQQQGIAIERAEIAQARDRGLAGVLYEEWQANAAP